MRQGSWAVVTGASAGIGEAIALALARRGQRLILAARRAERMAAVAAACGVETRLVAADLGSPVGREKLWAEVETLGGDVELLVNNAGFGLLGDFGELDRERQLALVELNVTALVDLAQRFVVLRRGAGGGGALINVASVVGLRPVPFHAVYAASKAFVVSFSLALAAEVEGDGIGVLALCPGPVPTEFQEIAGVVLDRGSRAVAISAEQVADEALMALARGRRLWVPGAAMRSAACAARLLPQGFVTRLGARLMRRRRS